MLFLALSVSLLTAQAQKKEARNVATFSKIAYRLPGKLYLRQGSPQKVEIEANEESLTKIKTNVEGDKLIIETESKWTNWGNDDGNITVYITVKDINAVSVSGSGELTAETKIVADELDLKVSGSGSLTAELQVSGELRADVSGSGGMELKGSCSKYSSNVSGSGKVTIQTASEEVSFSVSGSGKINASGTAKKVKANVSGSGRVLAANLEAERCEVGISGSGGVEINVKDELNANISGSGSVGYKGNPSKVNSHASGSGNVHKL